MKIETVEQWMEWARNEYAELLEGKDKTLSPTQRYEAWIDIPFQNFAEIAKKYKMTVWEDPNHHKEYRCCSKGKIEELDHFISASVALGHRNSYSDGTYSYDLTPTLHRYP